MSRTPTAVALSLLLAILAASLLGLAGCGGGSGKDKDDDPPDPPTLYTLSGMILDNDGVAVADALVMARMGDGSNALIDTTMSEADGAYVISIPAATAFYLHVEKAAYASTNSHIRELTGRKTGIDVVLLLQTQADTLLLVMGGPAALTTANVLYIVRALDPMGAELAGATATVTPIGLLVLYRLPDDTGYSLTGPTAACTAGGGCSLPQMAGYAAAINQGISTFQLSPAGGGTLAFVAAPLLPGQVTFVVND